MDLRRLPMNQDNILTPNVTFQMKERIVDSTNSVMNSMSKPEFIAGRSPVNKVSSPEETLPFFPMSIISDVDDTIMWTLPSAL